MIKKVSICRCGKTTENMNSYFHKVEKMRVTVCARCAKQHGLTDKEVWEMVDYNELTEIQKKTPNATNR
jgi:sulfur relay (sulfurtransferase) complex TusBCD TusD component (DsrE family)